VAPLLFWGSGWSIAHNFFVTIVKVFCEFIQLNCIQVRANT
jgi:hypothetical protein